MPGPSPPQRKLGLYRGIWCIIWREDGKTRRHSLATDDEKLAQQRFASEEQLAAQPRGDRVGDIWDAYYADKRVQLPKTHVSLAFAWKQLGPRCAHLLPEHIDRTWCREYAAVRREQGRSNGTILKELGVLKACLNWKFTKWQCPARFEMPPQPPPRDRHLTSAECARLIDAASTSPHTRLFIALGLTTAGRKQALLDLTWDRVDFERGIIQLGDGIYRTKGRATVPINPQALPLLVAARAAARTRFVIEWADRKLTSIRTSLRFACQVAGVPWVSPHVLRHTAACQMAMRGVSMQEISLVLGHTTIKVTERVYARYQPGYLKEAVESIGWDEPLSVVSSGS